MKGSASLLILAVLVTVSVAATYNRALTSSARAGVREDKLYFGFQRVAPPRRPSRAQVLVSLAFPGHSRFVVALDRGQGQVTIETVANGETETLRLDAPSVTPRAALSSLLVEVDQVERRANVYVDCRLQGSLTLSWTPREMASDGDEDLRVYQDRHVELSLDWRVSLLDLLGKLGCSEGGEGGPHSVQAQANEVFTYHRGDIPILHNDESCTKLSKTISELIEIIKRLQEDIQVQREETAMLREVLLNCEACKPGRDGSYGR